MRRHHIGRHQSAAFGKQFGRIEIAAFASGRGDDLDRLAELVVIDYRVAGPTRQQLLLERYR